MPGIGATPTTPRAPAPAGAPVGGALRNRSRRAAFLCYHSIADGGPPWLSIPPGLFERHLRTLRRLGYRSGLRGDLDGLLAGRRPDAPLVFLTFDDAYVDNFTVALPLLREHGFRAMVFLVPPLVDAGAPLAWPEVAEQRRRHPEVMRSMTWAMVEAMAEAGTQFGSHTMSHPKLPTLGDEELRQELLDARVRVAERLGSCDVLAYPFGHWDARVERAAADAGYRFAFSLPDGAQATATALSIPRIPIDHRDHVPRFVAKLAPPGRTVLLSPLKERLRAARAVVRP